MIPKYPFIVRKHVRHHGAMDTTQDKSFETLPAAAKYATSVLSVPNVRRVQVLMVIDDSNQISET